MENTNANNTNAANNNAAELTAAEQAQAQQLAKAINGMVEKEKTWLCAANVAALAAAGTALVTMLGKRNCDIGSIIGAAAGVGVSYLGTKWLTEAIGIDEHGLGKAMGLFIGIDLGYALTNLGSKVQTEHYSATESYL